MVKLHTFKITFILLKLLFPCFLLLFYFIIIIYYVPLKDKAEHEYVPLRVATAEVNSYLKQLLQSVDTKITNVYKLDKESWRMLDGVEKQCEKWKKEVESAREEQVIEKQICSFSIINIEDKRTVLVVPYLKEQKACVFRYQLV